MITELRRKSALCDEQNKLEGVTKYCPVDGHLEERYRRYQNDRGVREVDSKEKAKSLKAFHRAFLKNQESPGL